ncbi:MAG: hypothetical protein JXQ69_00295 [Paludibacteraceae bacterium]|nr:hypothetical protein [Paludibacteraceae bacterium]
MIAQNLKLDIYHDVYESVFRFLQCNENGYDGEKDRQSILLTLVIIGLLPMILRIFFYALEAFVLVVKTNHYTAFQI